jgi:NAD(P)-dependent dehydrogenase (short-subunit alcohol dehydrogenase family)
MPEKRPHVTTEMSGRVAIIAASGRGIGAACARALRARGYAVALMSRSDGAIRLARELGGIGLEGSVSCETVVPTIR